MRMPARTDQTHVEDVKDLHKILLPSSNLVLITFGKDESVDRIPFTLLDNIPLDLGQSSAIENVNKWITLHAHCRSGSRSQPSDGIEDGLVELIQLSSLQFPVEYLTYIATGPPKVDEILIVGHRVLDRRESELYFRGGGKRNVLESWSRGRSRSQRRLGPVGYHRCPLQGLKLG